jgi:CRISPR/Cas system-associated protein Csm6|tara:strand:+ start:303 stop:572 length:270 start_codon:yes stop_codon:yes gene_type:complete
MKTQTINVDIKKSTIQSAYNQVKMLSDLDFPNFQKGEPLHNLVMEIKRNIKRNKMTTKEAWIEFLQFWPLSIVVPGMIILILCANLFQW